MHPSFAQRVTALEGLRARARQATAEFYQKPGVMAPPQAPIFIVKPSGNNTFEVIERATGKIIAERFGHNNATGHARSLEFKAKQFNVKSFGRALTMWALHIGTTLLLLAFICINLS